MNTTDIRMIAMIDKDGKVIYMKVDSEDEITANFDIHSTGTIYYHKPSGEVLCNADTRHYISNFKIEGNLKPIERDLEMVDSIGQFVDVMYNKED